MSEKESNSCDTSSQTCPEFSVIISCYFEEATIDKFYSKLSRALESLNRTYEIVFVNDGSTDKTFEKLKIIFEKDPNVTAIIDLFRNVGQLGAMTAGIIHAQGKNFVFMDSDLQLEPEELPLLVSEFDKGFDIVSGYRKNRRDSLFRKLPSKIANLIVRKVSGHNIRDFGCTFKIYDARLIRAFGFGPFKKFQTAYVYSKAQKTSEVPVTHHPREFGKSGWTFGSLFSFLMDNLVGISQCPFQFLSLLCMIFAFLFFARIILAWFIPFSILPEVTPGLILNVILCHLLVTLASISAVGEYVIRNFASLQDYPIYIIKEKYKKQQNNERF